MRDNLNLRINRLRINTVFLKGQSNRASIGPGTRLTELYFQGD